MGDGDDKSIKTTDKNDARAPGEVLAPQTAKRRVFLAAAIHTGPVPEKDLAEACIAEGHCSATRSQSAVNRDMTWLEEQCFAIKESVVKEGRRVSVWRASSRQPPTLADVLNISARQNRDSRATAVASAAASTVSSAPPVDAPPVDVRVPGRSNSSRAAARKSDHPFFIPCVAEPCHRCEYFYIGPVNVLVDGEDTTAGGDGRHVVERCLVCDLTSIKRERDAARKNAKETQKKLDDEVGRKRSLTKPLERVRW